MKEIFIIVSIQRRGENVWYSHNAQFSEQSIEIEIYEI